MWYDTGMNAEQINETLNAIAASEPDTNSGKLFAYTFDPGNPAIKQLALEAYKKFSDKNCLDFTVFQSAIFFEREIAGMVKEWLRAPDSCIGVFTAGGTESVLLAALTAREHFKKLGKQGVPEIIAPATIHPSMSKAAFYFGMDIRKIPVDESGRVRVAALLEAISDQTALIALSAPNWAYGTVDPIAEVSSVAEQKQIPLHVDACVGGMVLPFMRLSGIEAPEFDFTLPGVTSVSVDFHKFGYTPKGASMVMFRDSEYAAGSIYVDSHTPGYVLVNRSILSTRSVGHLAAAYTALSYIGTKGYEQLAVQIQDTYESLRGQLGSLGFEMTTPSVPMILTFHHPTYDVVNFALNMKKKGWVLHLLKGYPEYNIPMTVHLTLSPVHSKMIEAFIRDAKDSCVENSGVSHEDILLHSEKFIRKLASGESDSMLIPLVLDMMEPDVVEKLIINAVNQWFKPK